MGIVIPWNIRCDIPRDDRHPMGDLKLCPGPFHYLSQGTSHENCWIPCDERTTVGMGCNDSWGIPSDEQPPMGHPTGRPVACMTPHGMDELP